MTTVRCVVYVPGPSGDIPADGSLDWVPTTGRIGSTQTLGTASIVPQPFTVRLNGSAGTITSVTVDPTDATWCWKVTERITGGGVRYVQVPSSGTVDYGALVDVDPATLSPTTTPAAAFTAALTSAIATQAATDSATFVPKSNTQVAETTALPIFTVTPTTAGFAPFQVHQNSFANSGAGAGTYNHTVHFGWNASRHSAGTGTVNGKPAIYMGFEDNYFDAAGDLKYGVEWYVGYVSPDGTSSPVGALRPFYSRVYAGNTDHSATTFMEVGTDGTGTWRVRTADSSLGGIDLLYINGVRAQFNVPLTVEGVTATFQSPTGSGLNLLLNARANNPALIFQRNAAASWTIQANSVDLLYTYDKNNRAHVIHTQGASAATAKTEFSAMVQVDGMLAAGSGSTTPTLAVTANDGGSPPTPSIVGNASRGVISFGSGTAPAAGAIITVTLPAGFSTTPGVALTPANFATSGRAVYVLTLNSTQFQIAFGNAPTASQPTDTYAVSYVVLG